MTSMVTLLFFMLLASRSQAQEGCSKDDILACKDPMLEMKKTLSPAEACKVIEHGYDCLIRKAEECLTDEDYEDVEEDFDTIEELLHQHCIEVQTAIDERKIKNVRDATVCAYPIPEHVKQCQRNQNQNSELWFEEVCIVLGENLNCIVDKIVKKCGKTAGRLLRPDLARFHQVNCQ